MYLINLQKILSKFGMYYKYGYVTLFIKYIIQNFIIYYSIELKFINL